MRRAVLTALVALAACGPGGEPMPMGDTFVAFASHFNGYVHWEKFEVSSAPVQGEVHSTGDRKVYLNRRPAAGATEFPVGTMVVKALPGVGRVFARAKRGGGYNAAGAAGWEWFELQHTSAEEVIFVWRGVGPPNGEGYGGDPNGCNVCHLTLKSNDTVSTAALNMSGL